MFSIDSKTKSILEKYDKKLSGKAGLILDKPSNQAFTKDYNTFRSEAMALRNSLYERACKFANSIINIEPSDKEKKRRLQELILKKPQNVLILIKKLLKIFLSVLKRPSHIGISLLR